VKMENSRCFLVIASMIRAQYPVLGLYLVDHIYLRISIPTVGLCSL